MAVNQATIKADLLSLFMDAEEDGTTAEAMFTSIFAGRLAVIIKDAILSADVTTTIDATSTATGVTAGSASAPVTGTTTGTLS